MMQASEEQVAALREEIRRPGVEIHAERSDLHRMFIRFLVFPAGGLAFLCVLWILVQYVLPEIRLRWIVLIPGALLVLSLSFAVVARLFAFPIPAMRRALVRNDLRRQLCGRPDEEIQATLVPLRDDPLDDTRKIVAPLLRELRVPSAVTPTDAPTGRGDEPTATA